MVEEVSILMTRDPVTASGAIIAVCPRDVEVSAQLRVCLIPTLTGPEGRSTLTAPWLWTLQNYIF